MNSLQKEAEAAGSLASPIASFCLDTGIFTSQPFDRVITSNSQETLVVLLAGTALAPVTLLLLEHASSQADILGGIIAVGISSTVVAATVTKRRAAREDRCRPRREPGKR